MDKKRIAQIIVPILILAVIVGIWFTKQNAEEITTEGEYALFLNPGDFQTLLTKGKPVMIDFGASWCGPCQMMKPDLTAANEKYAGKAYIKYVDSDEFKDFASNFPVQVVPTQVFYNADGTPYEPSEDLGIPFTQYARKDTQELVYTVHEGILTAEEMDLIFADMGVK